MPGAAQEAQDDRLGLIVEGVTERDARGQPPAGDQAERGMPQGVCRSLQRPLAAGGLACDVDAHEIERKRERGGELLAEGRVGVGLGAAQAVMDVHEPGEPGARPRRDRGEHVQQRDRIGPARDGDEDTVALGQQVMPPDRGPDARREASHVGEKGIASGRDARHDQRMVAAMEPRRSAPVECRREPMAADPDGPAP